MAENTQLTHFLRGKKKSSTSLLSVTQTHQSDYRMSATTIHTTWQAKFLWVLAQKREMHAMVVFFPLTARTVYTRDFLKAVWPMHEALDTRSKVRLSSSLLGFRGRTRIPGDLGTSYRSTYAYAETINSTLVMVGHLYFSKILEVKR